MKKLAFGLLMLVLVLALVAPAFAQEVTVEPTLEATVVATPVVTPDPVQVVRDGSTTISEFIIGVITGALVGGGGVLVAFSRILRFVSQNDVLKIAIERLFLSAPVETQQRVRAGVVTAKEAADLANELTDGTIGTPVPVGAAQK